MLGVRGAFSLQAFPDLRVRIPNADLGIGVSFDLDLELQDILDEAGGVLAGVFDGLDILVAVERVGATVMVNDLAGLGVCFRDALVPTGPELEPPTCGWRLADLVRCPDQDPSANHVFGELGRR